MYYVTRFSKNILPLHLSLRKTLQILLENIWTVTKPPTIPRPITLRNIWMIPQDPAMGIL